MGVVRDVLLRLARLRRDGGDVRRLVLRRERVARDVRRGVRAGRGALRRLALVGSLGVVLLDNSRALVLRLLLRRWKALLLRMRMMLER